MDPSDFLDIANRFRDSASEAERRTSISRAYYSLYNLLRDSLATAGVAFPGGGDDDRALVHVLTQCGDTTADYLGQALRTLRQVRNRADYELKRQIDVRQSVLTYALARQEFARFRALDTAAVDSIAAAIGALGPDNP